MDKTGIEFVERMSRLILIDDGIVGYEMHKQGCVWHSKDMHDWRNILLDYPGEGNVDIYYTSFNEGIKVGDSWWFTGDLLEFDEDRWILQFGNYGAKTIGGFYVQQYHPNNTQLQLTTSITEQFKKSGNIYDNPVPLF